MKRPFVVTLTFGLVLILTSWNALRAWTYIAWRNVLVEYKVTISPLVGAGIALFWVLAGLFVVWSIWQRKPWSPNLLLGMSAGYSVWYWIERVLWQIPHPNAPFAISVNLLCLIIVLIARKSLLREAYERNVENTTIE